MLKKVIKSIFLILIMVGSGIVYHYYQMIYKPNVTLTKGDSRYFYISTGWTLEDVSNALMQKKIIKNQSSFLWVAEKKNYKNHIHPGRYLLQSKMNNDDLINLFRSGKQEAVNVSFNSVRLINDLAGIIANQIEADSASLAEKFNDELIFAKYGFDEHSFRTMFIPNTYEMYWNTSADEFIQRMANEYKSFWNEQRKGKAGNLGLTQSEVSALAAIVEKETAKNDEKPRVAGVYLNRMKKGMPLQADPTLIFAAKDFSIKRVLNIHKLIDSPYNTYLYKGLPPGPITIPEISSIDGVLNYEKHDYMYFCAKEDFSGYHNFSTSYTQHMVNARKWYKAMNSLKIYK